MFEYKFQLEQHTPIIQFELDQPEAVLRASEVKPAFDRYLAECVNGNQIPEEWLVPGESAQATGSSFDYRMTIRRVGEVITMPIHSPKKLRDWEGQAQAGFPGFFALLGEDEPNHVFRWTESLELSVKTLHQDLLEIVKAEFPKFLWVSNFGMRKTKGFGSFTVAKTEKPIGKVPGIEGDFASFSFSVQAASVNPSGTSKWGGIETLDVDSKRRKTLHNQFVSWYEIFTQVNDLHRVMRSGWSKRDRGGFPALSARYAENEGYAIEKKVLQKAMDPSTRVEPTGRDRALRELFGLSNDQEWMSYKAKVAVEATSEEIGRFPSPILYKPVLRWKNENELEAADVHILPMVIPSEILDTEIQYSSKNFGRPVKVKTPGYFSMFEFLEFVVEWARTSEEASEVENRDAKKLINTLKNLKNA